MNQEVTGSIPVRARARFDSQSGVCRSQLMFHYRIHSSKNKKYTFVKNEIQVNLTKEKTVNYNTLSREIKVLNKCGDRKKEERAHVCGSEDLTLLRKQ